jgi:hypothetical protein
MPSPRFAEPPPRYNTATINRYDGPEDASLPVRYLMGGLPEIGTLGAIADRISFRRIVQTPGGISMFYDVGQGQGWQRNIVMDGSPHLPAGIRQWYGDSRGHWEGNTLVIDVTNFSAKTDFQGSRENRAIMSLAPPAANGTTMVTGRVGYACAHTVRERAGNAAAAAAKLKIRRRGCCVANRRSLPRCGNRRRGVSDLRTGVLMMPSHR